MYIQFGILKTAYEPSHTPTPYPQSIHKGTRVEFKTGDLVEWISETGLRVKPRGIIYDASGSNRVFVHWFHNDKRLEHLSNHLKLIHKGRVREQSGLSWGEVGIRSIDMSSIYIEYVILTMH